ncbi:MAG: DinB family protein [Saprospiraceae bacterium]|nr:DinB family protein [Saprospiraceae bacterium]
MEKHAITAAIRESSQEVCEWLNQQPLNRFEQGPQGKWNTSQHLDHIIKTAKLLNKALNYPKFMLRYKFGKPNREVRSREEVISRYQDRLQNIPPGTTSPITVQSYTTQQKPQVLDQIERQNLKLIRTINKWPENKLDQYLLPHPLMGRMIIREIIMWHAYHNLHHLKILKDKY